MGNFDLRNTFNKVAARVFCGSLGVSLAATAGLVGVAVFGAPVVVPLIGAVAAASAVMAAGSGIAYGFGTKKIQDAFSCD